MNIDDILNEIERILEKADKWGLRWEVERTAKRNILEEPEIPLLDAYIHAYNDWVK